MARLLVPLRFHLLDLSLMMSSTTSNDTLEAKELNLVGKVELRIALADSEPKLEALLKTYLCPLLLKLASEYVNVRNKVSDSA